MAEKNAEEQKEKTLEAEAQAKILAERIEFEKGIPELNIDELDRTLHLTAIQAANNSDNIHGAALGLPPGTAISFDEQYCHAMAGLVTYRYKVVNLDRCKYLDKSYTECYFDFKIEETINIDLSYHPGNALLQSILEAGVTRAYAVLIYKKDKWTIAKLQN